MSKINYNGKDGELVTLYEDLPNVGLGESTFQAGQVFIPDQEEARQTEYKFVFKGRIRLNGKNKKEYEVYTKKSGGAFSYLQTIYAPERTKKADLSELL